VIFNRLQIQIVANKTVQYVGIILDTMEARLPVGKFETIRKKRYILK